MRFFELWIAAALFSYTATAWNATRHTELVLSNAYVQPDGFSRRAIVVNGTTPGPPITANVGDHLFINVVNRLTDVATNTSSTVHWHGIHQHHMNSFDGVAFVTQCPIISGESYLHHLNIQNQSGTYWYHSNFNLQSCDGLRGPIVIYDPDDQYHYMYDVDDLSTIITINDWYHANAYALNPSSSPEGLLINGMGRYPGGPNTTLSVTTVEQGKRYRIRLINMSCKLHVYFTIDNHSFTIIEADGRAVQPYQLANITIYAAQRYSFILEANRPIDNYWIRVLPGAGFASSFTDGLNSAILRYAGAPDEEPVTRNVPTFTPLDEAKLHARDNPTVPGLPYPGGADVNINLVGSNDTVYWLINGVTYTPPEKPTLVQIINGGGVGDLVNDGSVYTLPPNKVIEVSFPTDFLTTPHPFHLHGHSFYVVRSAGSTKYNYINPVQRDTVDIGFNSGDSIDNVTIRFTTDNSGPWLLRCHIDWHLQEGFAVVFVENPNGTARADPVNDAWKNLCPAYYHDRPISTLSW